MVGAQAIVGTFREDELPVRPAMSVEVDILPIADSNEETAAGFQPWDPAWDDGSPSSGFTWAQNIYKGLDSGEPGRVPLLVGRKHELPDRPQHRTG